MPFYDWQRFTGEVTFAKVPKDSEGKGMSYLGANIDQQASEVSWCTKAFVAEKV